MQIAYLNTNGFWGDAPKPKNKKDYRQLSTPDTAELLFEKLFQGVDLKPDQRFRLDPDILFLAEFDMYSPAGKYALNTLKQRGYYPIYPDGPNGEKDIENKDYWSFVIAFAKKEGYKSETSPEETLTLKWNEIIVNDCRIVGVHIPPSSREHEPERAKDFWKALKNHFNNRKDKLIYIGDMNVYAEGTLGKKHFNELLDEGARDAWLEKGHSNDSNHAFTFIGRTRVDYVVLSENVEEGYDMENFQCFYKEKLSDHSLIAINFPASKTDEVNSGSLQINDLNSIDEVFSDPNPDTEVLERENIIDAGIMGEIFLDMYGRKTDSEQEDELEVWDGFDP